MSNSNYSIITNFGCHFKCPYCITKKSGLRLPKTDFEATAHTVCDLIQKNEIRFLSFSGGGDPMHDVNDIRLIWYRGLLSACDDNLIETEIHTSAYCIDEYSDNQDAYDVLEMFNRVVFHCANIDQIDEIANLGLWKLGLDTSIRIVYVVTPDFTIDYINNIETVVRDLDAINELTFRQMVNGKFEQDETLRDYLRKGHEEGRWHYTEQGDYNRYIVNNRIYDRFEDIVRSGRDAY